MSCLFVEQLTVIDCAYLDAARGLVGESWIVDLELEGDLDDQSMILDFGLVKRRIKQAIDGSVDHSLLVPALAPELSWHQQGEETRLVFNSRLGAIEQIAPAVAVTRIDTAEISAEAVRRHLLPLLQPQLPANVQTLRLRLRPEQIDGPYYHYTHGLKKHQGECQRIAHGHRSRIEVYLDDQRQADIEQAIALDWTDIYLASREDLVSQANGRMRFAYEAPEGHFELALPQARVRLLDSDTTVECIADALASRIASTERRSVRVRAYEGVNKGAISLRSG
jgi:6-pyruvoyl-tetrahydropterin synthase